MMRFRVEVMVILVAAATTHFVAALGKLIFVILMKLNIVDAYNIHVSISWRSA